MNEVVVCGIVIMAQIFFVALVMERKLDHLLTELKDQNTTLLHILRVILEELE